ncbi:hypothetical protein [Microvirga roseola]|uniref:hypothetical protein n=1 Tax=Microvirga roseola TaxID=2883126 RepID=UPI001E639D1A|nr:hypothetical protein [Microvirga roseola]
MNPTGLKPRFRSLYRQSTPGSNINEDGAGFHGRFAWIVDGATGITDERLTAEASDAAWMAGLIGERLQVLAGSGRMGDGILGGLEAEIRGAFDAATSHVPELDDHHAPFACLGLIEVRETDGGLLLEGRFLGDIVALVPSRDGIRRWTDERAKPFERKTLAALGAGGREPGRIPEVVKRQILENRAHLNRSGGYFVVNPRRAWAGCELRFEAEVRAGAPVVLATDGFMRLVDLFGTYTDETLHARLAEGRGDELMQELRERERGDRMADAYPRVKAHDDATVLVIAAETYG